MIPLLRPTLPKLKDLESKLEDVFTTGMLTDAKYTREFEKQCASYLKVGGAVAVVNGTSALTLCFLGLNIKGEVIIPSFTFSSGGHVPLWCGLKPVFADIDEETLNITAASIERMITPETTAIMPTHVFGNPCEIDVIEELAQKHNIKVIYDAAHAFGSMYKNKSVAAFGDASAISLTPTKVLTTGEGGLVIGKSEEFIQKVIQGKNNGDSFERETEFLGITARMGEFNAILGLEGLRMFPELLKRRLKMVELYKKELQDISGLSFQKIAPHATSVYQNLVILVDKEKFGSSRDELLEAFRKKEIETKVYFYPLHKKIMYREYVNQDLPGTESVGERIMNLPLYSHMPEEYVHEVCSVVQEMHNNPKKYI